MSDPSLFRLRVSYCKADRLAYLSHLEVAHALERTVRRSGLPFAISQGFSPHMKIGYGAALPVGVGSTCEIVDIFLTSYVAPHKALDALVGASSKGLLPFNAEYVEHTAKAASVAFDHYVYEVFLSKPVKNLSIPDSLQLVKKDKTKDVCIHDYLERIVVDGTKIEFMLAVLNGTSIRPDVLIQEILDATYGKDNPDRAQVMSISRTEQK